MARANRSWICSAEKFPAVFWNLTCNCPVNTDEFWQIIEDARETGDDCGTVVEAVRETLEGMSPEAVLGFEHELWRRMAESYRWDLWAIAFIVNGGCSDDGFDYFRGWLIAKGRRYFEAALADPERAADEAEPDANECEDMIAVAASIYNAKTGNYPARSGDPLPAEPAGDPWKEDELEARYPELCERFS
jgi:hypothetical protein